MLGKQSPVSSVFGFSCEEYRGLSFPSRCDYLRMDALRATDVPRLKKTKHSIVVATSE
jgi:hypothetical protein